MADVVKIEFLTQGPRPGWIKAVVQVSPLPDGGKVSYEAAAPCERRSSFTGSCMPFTCARQAHERTPTRGVADADDNGRFLLTLRTPNAYYEGLGTILVPPSLNVAFAHGGRPVSGTAKLCDEVPYRTLTYPAARSGAEFYDATEPLVRSQPDILRASTFPSAGRLGKLPETFWNGKPPM